MNDAGYKRWSKTEWWTEGYGRLWNPGPDPINNETSRPEEEYSGVPTACTKESIVYLTADSDEELSELKPDETYIIGGIVDRNRFKVYYPSFIIFDLALTSPPQNLCQDKAEEAKIRTARLPIGKYLANLPTRKVLTVNQVFEILIKWVETKDWEVALNHVMPKRKFNAEGKHSKSKGGVDEEDEQEEVGEDKEEAAIEGRVGAEAEPDHHIAPQRQSDECHDNSGLKVE